MDSKSFKIGILAVLNIIIAIGLASLWRFRTQNGISTESNKVYISTATERTEYQNAQQRKNDLKKKLDELVSDKSLAKYNSQISTPISKLLISVNEFGINRYYRNLFRELNLPPEKLRTLRLILARSQTTIPINPNIPDQYTNIYKPPAFNAAALEQSQLHELLDPAEVTAVNRYIATMPARKAATDFIDVYKWQPDASPINDQQANALTAIFSKNGFPPQLPSDPDDEQFADFQKEFLEIGSQVAQDAKTTLSENQLTAFRSYLSDRADEFNARQNLRIAGLKQRTATAPK